jgi:hypothetical protein
MHTADRIMPDNTNALLTPSVSETLPLPRAGVVCQPVADGAVLLDTASEVYYGLNVVGREVWELLPPASDSLAALCAGLRRRHPEVADDVIREDVTELLADLARAGLVDGPVPAPCPR